MCFLCTFKGIKWSGKVVYVTATAPLIFLTALLIRSVTLPGAKEGLLFFITPDFERLKVLQVITNRKFVSRLHFPFGSTKWIARAFVLQTWAEAAIQIFYTLGAAWGPIVGMACHNKFDHNIFRCWCIDLWILFLPDDVHMQTYVILFSFHLPEMLFSRDTMIVCWTCCGSSFYGGLVVFSVLGYLSHELALPIEDVVTSGPGLAFVTYPAALAKIPLAPLWSVCFFLILIMVGLDSAVSVHI